MSWCLGGTITTCMFFCIFPECVHLVACLSAYVFGFGSVLGCNLQEGEKGRRLCTWFFLLYVVRAHGQVCASCGWGAGGEGFCASVSYGTNTMKMSRKRSVFFLFWGGVGWGCCTFVFCGTIMMKMWQKTHEAQ